MKFAPETEADFLKHDHFVQWVLTPTKETDEYWKRWLQQNPDKVELLSTSRDMLLSFQWKEKHSMQDRAYFKILDNLLEENSKQNSNASKSTPRDNRTWFLVAASILLFSSVAAFTIFFNPEQSTTHKPLAKFNTKSVPRGAKITVVLPDGSVVKLNSMSDLKYPNQFSDTLREVYLTGQAFFEVKKNPDAPFIVHTKNFTTRVLGTSFDIQSYENESSNYVAVLTGKVNVLTSTGESEMLLPKEMSTYNPEHHDLNKSTFDPSLLSSWRNGVIVFDHVSFDEMARYLSRWYGVDFVVEKGFTVRGSYTGTFTKETLKNVLNGVSYSSHFKYNIVGEQVFISNPN